MNKSLLSKITNYINNHKTESRNKKIFITLASIVFITTILTLMKPAITMEEVLICDLDEHTHSSECYEEKFICDEETEENLNNESCYEKKLIHEIDEHNHISDCYGTSDDKESITYLTNMIDELPTVDEMNNKIEELSTEEEQKEYKDEIIATATTLYSYYLNLSDKVQSKITNISKLLEYNEKGLIELPKEKNNQTVTFNNVAPILDNDNSSNLETVETVDTSNIININLYDYFITKNTNTNINYKFLNVNNQYPGFFQSFGPDNGKITTDNIANWRFNFGDMVTVDRIDAINDGDKGGYAEKIKNTINEKMPSTQQALSGYIKNVLGSDGYPVIDNGNLSLKYLFNSSEGYAKQQNTENISRLFQYDEKTGKYHFDSRSNFAQFDKNTNTFTIYKQRVTPNFMIYPFGNFLPLNNIKTETTLASTIDKTYFDKVITSAKAKANDKTTYGDMTTYYSRVASRMSEWSSVMTTRNKNKDTWDAAFVANQYFELSELPSHITNEHFTNLYNIDFDEPTNFFFGIDMEMNFIQPKNGITGVTQKNPMIFEFSGDDDVWVYIDKILFLDLSGRHRHVSGRIDFEKGQVTYHSLDTSTGDTSETPYKTVTFTDILKNISGDKPELNEKGTFKNYSPHNFKFYYMERGSGSSVMKMNFNFPLVEKNSLMVTKELDNNDTELVGNPDFSFQILKPTDGEKTDNDELFITEGTNFDILDLNGNKINTGAVIENGIFKLKAGETAVFKEISADKGNYYVREILDTNWASQYENVTVDGESTTTNEDVVVGTDSFVGYESAIKDISDGHTSFVYTNKVDPYEFGKLKITKKLEGISNIDDVFKFKVTIDDQVLPLDYKYKVTDEEENTTEKTIIKDCDECNYGYVLLSQDETATIENILVGSSYEVEEIISSINGFDVEYEKETGAITKNQEIVEVTVTNIATGTDLKIPITKTIANPNGKTSDYKFKITEMESSAKDAQEKTDGFKDEVTITDVTNTKTLEEAFKLKYSRPNYDDETTNHYYKIEEISGTDNKIKYDNSIYIVKVTVTNTEELFNAKVVKIYKDYIDISERDDNENVTNIIEFINKVLVDLTITKEVQGNIEDSGEFNFEITLEENDTPLTGEYSYQKTTITNEIETFQDMKITPFGEEQQVPEETPDNEEGTITFDEEGKSNITLAHNEVITIYGIPYDAEYIIKELDTDGYVVTHSINQETEQEGYEVTGNLDSDNTNIKFINIGGYIMPDTGGNGSLIFGIIGLLLLIVPVIYIGYSFYKHERSVV